MRRARAKVLRMETTTTYVSQHFRFITMLTSDSPSQDLLRLQEILGPATRQIPEHGGASPEKVPFTGKIEVTRRRVLKDGRVKLKLSLLGVAVDKCGVCMSQFRRDERAALTPVCKHS